MLTIILWIILFYIALCSAAYFYQTKLIFPGAIPNASLYTPYSAQQITLQRDAVLLHGWRLESSAPTGTRMAIYFGGNGEDVVSMLPTLQKFGADIIYAFNYRSYGHSEGRPSQTAFYEDALAIYDDIAARHAADVHQLLIIGRSLGTAVAGYLASQRPADALILMTPLNSAIKNGKRMFPFIPVAFLIRHPFDLKTQAALITCPVLMLVADADVVIPPQDSLATYAAITSPKQLVRLPGVGHNNVFDNPNALKAIQAFVADVK